MVQCDLTPDQKAHYDRCVAKGTSHDLALLLATGSGPTANRTDERWRKGKYMAGLAEYPNDPGAVVHSRGEARARIDHLRRKGAIDRVLDGPANSGNPAQRRSRSPNPHG